jgi:hypothetical protein
LEQKQQEVDDLCRDLESSRSEADRLRLQLAEAKEQRLAESQSAAQERQPHLTEIHNHFESGSSAQVFNSKVNGKFKDKKKWKRNNKKIV